MSKITRIHKKVLTPKWNNWSIFISFHTAHTAFWFVVNTRTESFLILCIISLKYLHHITSWSIKTILWLIIFFAVIHSFWRCVSLQTRSTSLDFIEKRSFHKIYQATTTFEIYFQSKLFIITHSGRNKSIIIPFEHNDINHYVILTHVPKRLEYDRMKGITIHCELEKYCVPNNAVLQFAF